MRKESLTKHLKCVPWLGPGELQTLLREVPDELTKKQRNAVVNCGDVGKLITALGHTYNAHSDEPWKIVGKGASAM